MGGELLGRREHGGDRRRRGSPALERSSSEPDPSGAFLGHDLREGLGTIALFAGALETRLGPDLDPAVARDLNGIKAGLERMSALVGARGDLGNWDAGVERHHPLDANLVVRDAVANLHARITKTGSEIDCEPLPWISGHGPQLTRLFQNLVSNSIKFRDPFSPTRVLIAAQPQGRRWRFEIADNGVGISPELAMRAFDPPRARTDTDPEDGLGLLICARIVRAHGGQARADRRAGGGTTVSFDLPGA